MLMTATIRLVTFELQGVARTRCEHHAPQAVRDYLDCEQWPGWIVDVRRIDVDELGAACVKCRVEDNLPPPAARSGAA